MWKLNLKMMTGDNISEGDAESFFGTGLSRMTSMVKNGLNMCGGIVVHMKTVGFRNTTLCAPCAEKV